MTQRELVNRIRDDLQSLTALDLLNDMAEEELQKAIKEFETEWFTLEERVELVGPNRTVADVVFFVLEKKGVAFSYDSERIWGYGDELSYPYLIQEYVQLADGYLDELEYEITGDWDAGEDARIVAELGDRQFEGTLDYLGDWTDTDSLIDLFNRIVAKTEADRRFSFIQVDDQGQIHYVFFIDPDIEEDIAEYFESATSSREAYEKGK